MITNTRIHKGAKYAIIVGSIIMLFTVIFIQVWAAYYSVFDADDFSVANSMRPYGDSAWEYLAACFRYVKRTYLNWQGTYSSLFIWTILNPLNELGLPQLRVVMVLNALLYFFSLIFLMHTIFHNIIKQNYHVKLFAYTCVVYMVMNSGSYPEVFFWFNGAGTYSFPIICLLFSLGFFVLANTRDKNAVFYAVLASVLSIGSQGGSLAIGGVGCYSVLVLWFWFWMRSKKFSGMNLAVTSVFFAGAIINVIAPGNYIRHELYEEGIHPIAAIGMTIKQYFVAIKMVFTNNQFLVIFLLLILCGAVLYTKLQADIKTYTLTSLLFLITPAAAIFPVILGCGEDVEIPNRALFIIFTAAILVYSNMAMVAGYWIAKLIKEKEAKPVWMLGPLAVLLFVFLFRAFFVSDVRDTVMVGTLRNLYYGRIQEYYKECKGIYEYLEECGEMDVVIENYPERVEDFGVFKLYTNPDEWENTCVANYYYKNSVRTAD